MYVQYVLKNKTLVEKVLVWRQIHDVADADWLANYTSIHRQFLGLGLGLVRFNVPLTIREIAILKAAGRSADYRTIIGSINRFGT